MRNEIARAISEHAADLDTHARQECIILDRAIGEARSADEELRESIFAAVRAKLERVVGEHAKAGHGEVEVCRNCLNQNGCFLRYGGPRCNYEPVG
jgi:hypothetical protein